MLVFGVFLLIFAVPAGAQVGQYWIIVAPDGSIIPGGSGGNGYPDPIPEDLNFLGQWYFYPQPADPAGGWYNQWWYNAPYDPCRRKNVSFNFFYAPFVPGMPGSIEVTINWALPGWSQNPDQPPLPADELFVERFTPSWIIPLPPGMPVPGQFMVDTFQLPIEYNPEWVSIDVRGFNFQILGIPSGLYSEIYHACIPWTVDTQNPIAVIKGDYKNIAGINFVQGGTVHFDGSSSSDDCVIVAYDWQLKARGNPANNKSASGKKPTITSLAKDTYDVTLTVTDNVAKTGKATMVLKSCFIATAMYD
jgi:hypothetical protein